VPIRASREVVDDLKPLLSSDEWERAVRFRAEEHRDLFVVGRAILRKLLSCYVPQPAESLVFRYGSKGKPHLRDYPDLQFNLAHSGGCALYAVGTDELGVDIELIKPSRDWRKISARFFSPREVEELTALDASQRLSGFFSCWTRKEAYIKATGEGMSSPLDKFYAGGLPSPDEGPIEEEGKPRQWYFKDLEAGAEYAAAIVTRFAQCRVRVFEFSRPEDSLRFAMENRKYR
jgi:4'-phosphopantetheinyl transferase